MAMSPEELKKNFDEQLAQTEKQINELEANLAKAREYRTKLQGGLETLTLLEDKGESPETSQTGNPIVDGVEVVKPLVEGEPTCPEEELVPYSVAQP